MGKYRIPGNTMNISDHWADHRARGSLGGTDFTDGRGTVMRAMAAGTVVMVDSNPDGSGGRMITIRHDDGDSTEELHALFFVVARGQRVAQGDPIGQSSGSGFGSDYYYGPHIHAHGVHANGVRFDVEPHIDFSNLGTALGGGATSAPISPARKKNMQTQWDTNGTGYLVTDNGVGAVGTMQLMNLFDRNIAGKDRFNATEMQMMDAHLRLIARANTANTTIDQAKFASAIVDALRAQNDATATLIANKIAAAPLKLTAISEVKAEDVAKALDAAMLTAIPRISAAIVKQSGEKLAA